LVAGLVLGLGAPLVTSTRAGASGGGGWSIVPSANSSSSQLNSLNQVSCVTASDCWAVGSVGMGPFDSMTLAEHWNGGVWSIVPTPNPSASTLNVFNGVFCLSSSDCWATGLGNGTNTDDQTLAEHWNGSTWSIVPTPNPSSVSILGGVHCNGSMDCWTVGHEAGQTLAEHWNGTAWTVVATPNTGPTEENELGNVGCVSATDCWAVGDGVVGAVEQTLAEHWNGSAWSIISTPDSSPSQQNALADVACLSGTDCWAVGFQDTGAGGDQQTLAEHWNGAAWSIVTTGTLPSTQGNYLVDVSCVSSTNCWAVGASNASGVGGTLAEHWDGSAWTVAPTPSASYRTVFGGVSCPSVSTCWAVGLAANGTGGTVQTLTQRWSAFGYWEVASDGGIFNFGDAGFFGSMGGQPLNAPIVGVAGTGDGGGYWEVASDGGIFNFGDAGFFGSMGGQHLNKPMVAMASTANGNGYWEVASDGGIFNYGSAVFFGSTGGLHLNAPVVGMAPTPDGAGYWLVASDGGIFNYGDARFFGSTGGLHLNAPIVGMAATPDGGGYWLVASDGGIFTYGDAVFFGSMGGQHLNQPIAGMARTGDGGGYWEVAGDGGIFTFGDAVFEGSMGGQHLNKPIVGVAATS
jgi:hypothetical protein